MFQKASSDTTKNEKGWEVAGVPALSYSTDEGLSYGAMAEIYYYGQGAAKPYRFTVQPEVVRSTAGQRDYSVFVDMPEAIRKVWRITARLGYRREIRAPFYGMGNEAVFRPSVANSANPYFYRFGLLQQGGAVTLQRSLRGRPVRALIGAQIEHVTVDAVPEDKGSTLLQEHLATRPANPDGWANSLRIGVVWDSRDRQVGPRQGSWSELLVRRSDQRLGSKHNYTRWTLTDRRYFLLLPKLVLANRLLLQQVYGNVPFYSLSRVESSFKGQEGLGGEDTVRGIFRNRYLGQAMFLWNIELRWRVTTVEFIGRSFYLVVNGFIDNGRVWKQRMQLPGLVKGLHHGMGGGLRAGMGKNFVLSVDMGYSTEAGLRIYTGTGYTF